MKEKRMKQRTTTKKHSEQIDVKKRAKYVHMLKYIDTYIHTSHKTHIILQYVWELEMVCASCAFTGSFNIGTSHRTWPMCNHVSTSIYPCVLSLRCSFLSHATVYHHIIIMMRCLLFAWTFISLPFFVLVLSHSLCLFPSISFALHVVVWQNYLKFETCNL